MGLQPQGENVSPFGEGLRDVSKCSGIKLGLEC